MLIPFISTCRCLRRASLISQAPHNLQGVVPQASNEYFPTWIKQISILTPIVTSSYVHFFIIDHNATGNHSVKISCFTAGIFRNHIQKHKPTHCGPNATPHGSQLPLISLPKRIWVISGQVSLKLDCFRHVFLRISSFRLFITPSNVRFTVLDSEIINVSHD